MQLKPRSLSFPGNLPLVGALLGIAVSTTAAFGDVIILRDGFALHGKIGSEQENISDPLTGLLIAVKKASGFRSMDDGPRWTVFSDHYKRVGDVNTFNKFEGQMQLVRRAKFGQYGVAQYMTLSKATEFDARWKRTLYYRDTLRPNERYDIEQQIDILTPHYARVISTSHFWTNYYLTRELGVETVRKLLHSHEDLAEQKGKPDVDKRARIIRFLIQAEWLAEADEEIERMLADLPTETKRAEDLHEEVRTLRIEKSIADIERAKESGRHGFAQNALKGLPKEKVPAKLALKIAGLRAEYDAAVQKLEHANKFLVELRKLVKPAAHPDLVKGAEVVESELHLDSVGRLDLFLTLAEQAENARKLGKEPMHKPEHLLAAAICGWLMGNNSTETNLATARKRLKAREVALNYLSDSSSQQRRAILLAYEQDPEALPFDELEKLISLLPPPEADKNTSRAPVEMKTGRLPGQSSGVRYLLQLPPEYHHSRPYPLLVVFPNGGERMDQCVKRLGDLAGKHGYVVAAMDWNSGGMVSSYDYKDDEAQVLAMGLVRHLRRTLQIDSDKVFLFGYGEGANLALDLGACHPGDFAGIIPMCPSPDPFLFSGLEHWKNFQNLPVYMVAGDKIGEPVKEIRRILSSWVSAGYPSLCAIYKGRGFEFFGEEMPYVFDWMSRKKRATGLPDLGKQLNEYRTVRASSNHFFWVSSNEIDPRNVRATTPNVRFPAKVHAHILEGNRIVLNVVGMREVSIWLGRESIDFAKPVVVKIEDRLSGNWSKMLTPKVSVLLEDLYDRGDRQRPFFQRIDCQDLLRTIKFSAQ